MDRHVKTAETSPAELAELMVRPQGPACVWTKQTAAPAPVILDIGRVDARRDEKGVSV